MDIYACGWLDCDEGGAVVMTDFSSFRRMSIPEGEVVQITDGSGKVIWRRQYLNLVSGSIGADGKVYNGTGYRDNYDIQSSTGNERTRTGSVITGFIPIEIGAKIYIKDGFWGSSATAGFFCSFTIYDKDFNFLNGAPGKDSVGSLDFNSSSNILAIYAHKTGADAVLEIRNSASNAADAMYYRLSLKKTGEAKDLIVTHDEEVA